MRVYEKRGLPPARYAINMLRFFRARYAIRAGLRARYDVDARLLRYVMARESARCYHAQRDEDARVVMRRARAAARRHARAARQPCRHAFTFHAPLRYARAAAIFTR